MDVIIRKISLSKRGPDTCLAFCEAGPLPDVFHNESDNEIELSASNVRLLSNSLISR